jgi:hypothetical protein
MRSDSHLDPASLQVFLESLLSFPSLYERISETVELRDGPPRRIITLSFRVPDLPSRGDYEGAQPVGQVRYLLPLFARNRGQLINNLDADDAAGNRLPLLSQAENKEIASKLLQQLLARAWGDGSPIPEDLSTAISRIPYVTQPEGVAQAEVVMSGLREAGVDLATADAGRLGRLAMFFAHCFVVSVELRATPGDRTVIQYSYDSSFERQQSSLRVALGQRPYRVRVKIERPFHAASYHLRIVAPSGQYCYLQEIQYADRSAFEFERLRPRSLWPSGGLDRSVQYLGRDSRRRPFAHLYLHGCNGFYPQDLFARAIFYERPPGSLGRSFIISLLNSIVLLGVSPFYLATINSAGSVDTAALLVAAPGIFALGLQASTVTSPDVLQSPLSARVGLLGSAALSFAAALTVALGNAATRYWSAGIPNVAVTVVLATTFALSTIGAWVLTTLLARRLRRSIADYAQRNARHLWRYIVESVRDGLRDIGD